LRWLPHRLPAFQEEQLRRPVRELQSFAKEARRSAIAENRSYELLLLNDRFILETADRKAEGQRPETGYQLPSDVTFAIKRLNDTGFGGSADARWIFLPNGLVNRLRSCSSADQDGLNFESIR